MKNRILLILAFFLVAPYVYSQHIADAMPVDIPLNSTKESAIQKLLNRGFWLYGSREEDGCKILVYKNKNDKKVSLWFTGSTVSIVSWELYFPSGAAELLFNSSEAEGIEMELEDVYGIKPYATYTKKRKDGSVYDMQKYYHWKGNTIILGAYELIILSNANAEKRCQKEKQEVEYQNKKKQEQKERQDAVSEARSLQYSSCKFLFHDDISFNFWMARSFSSMTDEIKRLIDKRMRNISDVVVIGTELSDNAVIKDDLIAICNIAVRVSDGIINNHVESKLKNFVSEREFLAKAYKESNKNDYAEFLLDYCKNKYLIR